MSETSLDTINYLNMSYLTVLYSTIDSKSSLLECEGDKVITVNMTSYSHWAIV